jgi:2-amino-4-hydroxy-6-hydroxymethyldihydropteridine diphosphokinase
MILKNNESAFLSIGSNLGARRENLRKALSLLSGTKVAIKQSSSLYETEPIGIQQQREFVNLACELTCHLEPVELLEHCLTVERQMGRCRARRNGPRIIDIDIIFFGREVIDLDHLKVPHPRRMERRFVLVPMNEIAPLFVDPVSQSTVSSMLEHCPDLSWVRKIEETSSWSASPENESDPTFR